MNSNEDLELSEFATQELNIEPKVPETHYSALQMFATSLGLCTHSVLASFADRVDVNAEELSMRIHWSYKEKPFRIGNIEMHIHWPGLPSSRQKAARRAAALRTIHNTLEQSAEVITSVSLTGDQA